MEALLDFIAPLQTLLRLAVRPLVETLTIKAEGVANLRMIGMRYLGLARVAALLICLVFLLTI
tara:strand:+ start:272 stop:460 length:189 start_codon:yes stop_codon:yes gene_type:complete